MNTENLNRMDQNLFRGTYRIPSARLKNWDYRSSAPYFITICCHKMQHFFGKIEYGKMILNDLGIYTRECIDNMEIYYTSDAIENANPAANNADISLPNSKDAPLGASLQTSESCKSNISIINQIIMPNHLHMLIELKNHTNDHQPNRFGPLLKNSLSSILNHFKGRITKFAKKQGTQKIWHPRFHDHIIRDMIEYQRIFDYITNNPANWNDDKFNKYK